MHIYNWELWGSNKKLVSCSTSSEVVILQQSVWRDQKEMHTVQVVFNYES